MRNFASIKLMIFFFLVKDIHEWNNLSYISEISQLLGFLVIKKNLATLTHKIIAMLRKILFIIFLLQIKSW